MSEEKSLRFTMNGLQWGVLLLKNLRFLVACFGLKKLGA